MESDANFEAFYEDSYERVVHVVFLLVGSVADAEDLAQEAFARAYRKRRQLASYESPEGWVCSVALKLAYSKWRRARTAALHLVTSRPPEPAHIDESAHRRIDLARALSSLPARQREIVIRHYYGDEPVAVIAQSVGMSEGSVRTHLSAAERDSLRCSGDPS